LQLLLILSGVLIIAAIVAIPFARVEYHRLGTCKRLQYIHISLENYHQTYGCYPPQYLTDRQGRPAHSWRVLILQFLKPDLYQRYRFDEPWNGPHNKLLAAEMPEEYRSPFLDSNSTITQYVGIAGEGTPWQGTIPLHREDLIRGRNDLAHAKSNPLVWFVEAASSDINWMEPRDIPLKQALVGINVAGGIQSNYSEGLPAQMIPYGCKWVPVNTSPNAFRAMLTIDGGKDKSREKTSSSANGKHPSPDVKRPPNRTKK